uniref:Uncharacterized protein n=1 Tax=viral metagenome TaxID=1070528 RepID=A0A6C0E717_9ZZZZ
MSNSVLLTFDKNNDYDISAIKKELETFLQNPACVFRNARNLCDNGTLKNNNHVGKIKKEQEKVEGFFDVNNILWRSRYAKFKTNILDVWCINTLSNIRVIDFLIFNKNYVISDLETLDRLLGACYFSSLGDLDHCIVDGWEIKSGFGYNKVTYNDTFEFSRVTLGCKDYHKLHIARALISLMNETDPSELNFTNYFWVNVWLDKYEIFLGYLENFHSVDDKDNKVANINIENRQFIFRVTHVLSVNFIQEQVNLAIKQDYNYIDQIENVPKNNENPSYKIIVDEVGCVNLKYLKTILRDNTLKWLILHCLPQRLDNYIYCEDVPPEEMLMELYNTRGTTGYGLFQFTNRSLSKTDACKLLSENKYFDYLYGVMIKINFKEYPLMNISRYDEHYGKGTALQCLENVKNEMLTNRETATLKFY